MPTTRPDTIERPSWTPPALDGHLRPRAAPHPRWRDEGSITVEMTVLVVPLLIVLALFTAFCARGASCAIDVHAAAAAAARAASLASSAAGARTAATASATDSLSGQRVTCASLTVAVDTGQFHRGGAVTVIVSCTIALSDLGLPGTRTVTASSTSPVDLYRELGP